MGERMAIDIFEAYETDLRLRGAKPESITNYLRVATRWRTWCEDNGLDPMSARKADVQAWLLSTGWAPSTMRQVGLVSLSAAYSFAVDDLEVIDRNPCRKVRLPKPIQRVIRTVPNRVLREIKAHVRDDYDLLLFCLFAYTGCRTVEVVGLTWDKVSLADNVMLVLGKGDKERLVPLHPELRRCLVSREPITRGSRHVIPGRRGARITHGGLAYQTHRVWGAWGVQNHDLRRTVASSLRANHVDPVVRDSLMGWSRGDIFSRHYSAVSPQELQDAITKLYLDDPV